jgi:hypothetical protein
MAKRARALGPLRIPPTLVGRSVENRLIEYIMVLSRGELVVCRPETDIEGTDLHVNRRYGRTVVKLQVKGRGHHDEQGRLELNMNKSDIPRQDAKYVVVAEYFPGTAEFGRYIWIIFSDDVRRLARSNGKQWGADFSTKPGSKDQWVPFRYELKEIAPVVSALLDRVERGEEMLRTAREVRAAIRAPKRRRPHGK